MNGERIVMVTKSSATNGMNTKNEDVAISLNRNHSDIVKFGKHDDECSRAVDVLNEMVKRAMQRAAGEPFTTPLRAGSGFSPPTRMQSGFPVSYQNGFTI
jgi:hypothetical protein